MTVRVTNLVAARVAAVAHWCFLMATLIANATRMRVSRTFAVATRSVAGILSPSEVPVASSASVLLTVWRSVSIVKAVSRPSPVSISAVTTSAAVVVIVSSI